jgi:very-short-patch-repair endonuclease
MKKVKLVKVRNNLKRNPTIWEMMFFKKLRRWGVKFEFQKITCGFIPDFYLPAYSLLIEIDGSGHHTESGIKRDKYRDSVLQSEGFTVLHIRNSEVRDFTKEDLLNAVENIMPKPTDRQFFSDYLASLH